MLKSDDTKQINGLLPRLTSFIQNKWTVRKIYDIMKAVQTTAKTSKDVKIAKDKTEAKEEEKKAVITDITPEEKETSSCQQILSSIIDWSMDALMFQNIISYLGDVMVLKGTYGISL